MTDHDNGSNLVKWQEGGCPEGFPKCPRCANLDKMETEDGSSLAGSCAFDGLRRFQYEDDGAGELKIVKVADFLSPIAAVIDKADLKIWKVNRRSMNRHTVFTRKRQREIAPLIRRLYPTFVKIVTREMAALNIIDISERIWRRMGDGVRETCDSCSTSIFNASYTCTSCGLMACPDCVNESSSPTSNKRKKRRGKKPGVGNFSRRKKKVDAKQMQSEGLRKIRQCKSKHKGLKMSQRIPMKIMESVAKLAAFVHTEIGKTQPTVVLEKLPIHLEEIEKKLFVMQYAGCEERYEDFEAVWDRGEPIMIRGVKLNQKLWSPETFDEKFGREIVELINYISKNPDEMPQELPMSAFWERFGLPEEDQSKLEELYKLKDWPPNEFFSKICPEHFKDLMDHIPMRHYTRCDGKFNLAVRLLRAFVPPDLGPKMYIACGLVSNLNIATTALHLDISDAVNICAYAPDPTKEGAIWHIFKQKDRKKLREFLKEVAAEEGYIFQADSDPIHDQKIYLDDAKLALLKEQKGVTPWMIKQRVGDAIFIPAGCPHQVRNVQDCIKVAEDFVSASTISQCLDLTEEIRQLSDLHDNHKDKLQLKSIVYFSMADALSKYLAFGEHKLEFDEETLSNIFKNMHMDGQETQPVELELQLDELQLEALHPEELPLQIEELQPEELQIEELPLQLDELPDLNDEEEEMDQEEPADENQNLKPVIQAQAASPNSSSENQNKIELVNLEDEDDESEGENEVFLIAELQDGQHPASPLSPLSQLPPPRIESKRIVELIDSKKIWGALLGVAQREFEDELPILSPSVVLSGGAVLSSSSQAEMYKVDHTAKWIPAFRLPQASINNFEARLRTANIIFVTEIQIDGQLASVVEFDRSKFKYGRVTRIEDYGQFICVLCGRSYGSYKATHNHWGKSHVKELEKTTASNSHSCLVCNRDFETKNGLKNHGKFCWIVPSAEDKEWTGITRVAKPLENLAKKRKQMAGRLISHIFESGQHYVETGAMLKAIGDFLAGNKDRLPMITLRKLEEGKEREEIKMNAIDLLHYVIESKGKLTVLITSMIHDLFQLRLPDEEKPNHSAQIGRTEAIVGFMLTHANYESYIDKEKDAGVRREKFAAKIRRIVGKEINNRFPPSRVDSFHHSSVEKNLITPKTYRGRKTLPEAETLSK